MKRVSGLTQPGNSRQRYPFVAQALTDHLRKIEHLPRSGADARPGQNVL